MLDSRGIVKVLDLGLAFADPGSSNGDPAGRGSEVGTHDYLAPEQAERARRADARARPEPSR